MLANAVNVKAYSLFWERTATSGENSHRGEWLRRGSRARAQGILRWGELGCGLLVGERKGSDEL